MTYLLSITPPWKWIHGVSVVYAFKASKASQLMTGEETFWDPFISIPVLSSNYWLSNGTNNLHELRASDGVRNWWRQVILGWNTCPHSCYNLFLVVLVIRKLVYIMYCNLLISTHLVNVFAAHEAPLNADQGYSVSLLKTADAVTVNIYILKKVKRS